MLSATCSTFSRAFLDGVAFVANLAFRVVNQIHSNANLKPPTAYSGVSQCSLDIWFKNGGALLKPSKQEVRHPNIIPVKPDSIFWRRSHFGAVHRTGRTKYPIRIKSFSVRPQSGGSGENAGATESQR